MKVGRNDPCRCGSGKKYKRCCMTKSKEVQKSNAEIQRRKEREAVNDLFFQLADQECGEEKIEILHSKIKHFNMTFAWDVYPEHPLYDLIYDFDVPLYRVISKAREYGIKDYYEVVEPLYSEWRSLKDEYG